MILIMFMSLTFMLIPILLLNLNLMMSTKMYMIREKKAMFECGFEMYQNMRMPFSIHFFFIAMLFLIFDVEIIFLYAMVISSSMMSFKVWAYSSYFVLFILFSGLEFEKKEGPLKWML